MPPPTWALTETVETESTFRTAVTSTGIVFWVTLPTVTEAGGRAAGAACGFAQPEASAHKEASVIGQRPRNVRASMFLRDLVINVQSPVRTSIPISAIGQLVISYTF